MAEFPHTILQESFSFLVFNQDTPPDALTWQYEDPSRFQITCDQSSIQRLLLLWLEACFKLRDTLEVTISLRENPLPGVPYGIAFRTSQVDSNAVATIIESEPGIKELLAARRLELVDHGILFPVQEVSRSQKDQPLDLTQLHGKFEDPADAQLLLELFMQHTPVRILQLEDALSADNSREAHRLAHSIKGGALNICAADLAETAKTLEVELKTRGCTPKTVELLSTLKKRYGLVDTYWNSLEGEQ
ncbi:Hpt domain-containing protein [Spirochaeta lutea]|uniref:HPt domain-containing protein n=1 Tax=Spirochaeta lutea TaxID=1480694 RepID=A0A098QWE2_9SPIO|nr:Hpt domain-containing protein [Spirochaeta lutea]KGE71851.1 hypothetical protein DC28_08455 [Spirochaeta lutea]